MGLSINTTKTEVVCQWSSRLPPSMLVFTIYHKSLAIVPLFKYLGSILSEDCSIDLKINNWLKQASAAFGKRTHWLANSDLHLHTKVCITIQL